MGIDLLNRSIGYAMSPASTLRETEQQPNRKIGFPPSPVVPKARVPHDAAEGRGGGIHKLHILLGFPPPALRATSPARGEEKYGLVAKIKQFLYCLSLGTKRGGSGRSPPSGVWGRPQSRSELQREFYGGWARRVAFVAIAVAALFATPLAHAVEPDEILSNPAMEARARAISAELRCLVCQNQSIDDSNAPLARDLRLIVRERLKAGDSDDAVMNFVVARYGAYVLLRPPFGWETLILWLAPSALLLLTMIFLVFKVRRDRLIREARVEDLTPAEKSRLETLLASEPPRDGKA